MFKQFYILLKMKHNEREYMSINPDIFRDIYLTE